MESPEKRLSDTKRTRARDLEWARKMLALRESAKGTPEGDQAGIRLSRLLFKYGWTEQDVVLNRKRVLPDEAPEWQRDLIALVATSEGCEVMLDKEEGDENRLVCGFEGYLQKVGRAEFKFERLKKRVERASDEFADTVSLVTFPHDDEFPDFYETVDEHLAKLKHGFGACAIMGLLERLLTKDEPDDAPKPPDSPDDVLGKQKIEAAEEAGKHKDKTIEKLTPEEFEFCWEGYEFGQTVRIDEGIEALVRKQIAQVKNRRVRRAPVKSAGRGGQDEAHPKKKPAVRKKPAQKPSTSSESKD